MKTGPRLPSKRHWRTYRWWKDWPKPPQAEYTLDVRRARTAVQYPKFQTERTDQ